MKRKGGEKRPTHGFRGGGYIGREVGSRIRHTLKKTWKKEEGERPRWPGRWTGFDGRTGKRSDVDAYTNKKIDGVAELTIPPQLKRRDPIPGWAMSSTVSLQKKKKRIIYSSREIWGRGT